MWKKKRDHLFFLWKIFRKKCIFDITKIVKISFMTKVANNKVGLISLHYLQVFLYIPANSLKSLGSYKKVQRQVTVDFLLSFILKHYTLVKTMSCAGNNRGVLKQLHFLRPLTWLCTIYLRNWLSFSFLLSKMEIVCKN